MDLDAHAKAALLQSCGLDVDKLYEKYANSSNNTNTSSSSNERNARNTTPIYNPRDNSGDEDALARIDHLVICNSCNGQGIRKQVYNYQVRDVDCDVCGAEGILWKCPRSGRLVHWHERPMGEDGDIRGGSDDSPPPPMY